MMASVKAPGSASLSAAREVLELLGDNKARVAKLKELADGTKVYLAARAEALQEQKEQGEEASRLASIDTDLVKLRGQLEDKGNALRLAAKAVKAREIALQKVTRKNEEEAVKLDSEKEQLEMYKNELRKRDAELSALDATLSERRRTLKRKAERITAIAEE